MIPKHYEFGETEKRIYSLWQEQGCFQSAFDRNGNPNQKRVEQLQAFHTLKNHHQATDLDKLEKYVVVIPPPNVTGRLHMGHALNNTIQDLLIRYHRMNGKDALWIPGTDHAGIATQTVVKKMLDEQGVDYREIGRKAFNDAVWKWKQKYGDIILGQMRALGISSDWSRVAYTMDARPSAAVRHAFVKLYEAGYIYRAKRIVNWCPIDKTALSDDEVETAPEGEPGFLYQIAYPIIGAKNIGENIEASKIKELVVSTTRPETLFGDVAVAVHPEDERYQDLIGKRLQLPLGGREIPIIADSYVDQSFGTGCLKITPAHDPNDFLIGEAHGFSPINIMHEDATLNDEVPSAFRGRSREEVRKQVIVALEAEGLFRGKVERMVPVGRSYRSKAIIEYRLSDQWFVKMEPLSEAVLKSKDLHIYPNNYIKLWNHWLTNIRDWCISRQIWWGHQIPAWFHKTTGEVLVSENTPSEVEQNPDNWEQDPDVLDTWFSSALWPMSTLGWPAKGSEAPDFERYFPTTTLSTAKDIIFFWVARMCLMALYFEKALPFGHVYFHPTVMDHRGKIMSKSKGNGIDPQHIISGATVEELKAPVLDARPANMADMLKEIEVKHQGGFVGVGADAMRYTLIFLSSHLQSLQISLDSFSELGRRFTDKLWNASRLIFLYLEKLEKTPEKKLLQGKTTVGISYSHTDALWIEGRIFQAWESVTKAVENYDFSALGQTYYNLVWSDFCDWYLEAVKLRLIKLDTEASEGVDALVELIAQFEKILTLLHPLIPFLSEELYQKLAGWSKEQGLTLRTTGEHPLMVSPFLKKDDFNFDEASGYREAEKSFKLVQEVVGTLRNYQKNILVGNSKVKPSVYFTSHVEGQEAVLHHEQELVIHLAKLSDFSLLPKEREGKAGDKLTKLVKEDFTLYLPKDENEEIANSELLKANLEKLLQDQAFINKRLSNQGFVKNAKPEVIAKEQERLEKIQQAVAELRSELEKSEN